MFARTTFTPQWKLARIDSPRTLPSPKDWIKAKVPGAVQLDWAKARKLPDVNFGQNVEHYQGLEDYFWIYRTTIPEVDLKENELLFLNCKSVDFSCEVRLDGEPILTHTGMLSPLEIDVTTAQPGSTLDLLIHPAPKDPDSPADRSQAHQVTKPAVSYGWDWHPRLITLGLADECAFEIRPAAYIKQVDFAYTLSPKLDEADITVTIETSLPAESRWSLLNPHGEIVLDSNCPHATLRQPLLWWTHDHGKPNLYTLKVELENGDSLERKVGFRRIKLVMHPTAWEEPSSFPKSRSHPPVTIELNGRQIFAKGSNWVNPELFHGSVTAKTYQPLIKLAHEAHFNILRCWGGAPVAKRAFFDLCDAHGILVWQEFPLACNNYPDDPTYLHLLDQESRTIIHLLRQHPCLALWVGGNELFNAWSGMTDQSLALRLLNRNCYDLDPLTPFLPTAPVDGMGHGDYRFRDEKGRDIFQIFQQAASTAYSEFGCPGPSPVAYLKKIIPQEELWPPKAGSSWETHHALKAWDIDETSWFCLNTIKHYFGQSETLEIAVARGEWLQSEGYKSVFEEARRQKPRCAMALNWCFNEPWPSAANNSIINWPAQPKPSYNAVKSSCRPTLASARIPTFQWNPGDLFTAELWLLNDCHDLQPGGEITAYLVFPDEEEIELLRWSFACTKEAVNIAGPTVRYLLPDRGHKEFQLVLRVTDQPEWDSSYRLSLKETRHLKTRKTRALNM